MELIGSSYHLCYHHILIFIVSHLWTGIDSESVPGYSINVASHVTVQRGLCMYIPCSFTVPETVTITRNAWGAWYKTGTPNVVASKWNNVQQNNGRFFLLGEIWRRDCSLYIKDPLYEDEGNYRFRVEDNINFNYLAIQPYIEVTELKVKPEISPIKSWLEGETVALSCTSPRTCVETTPKFIWQGHNGRVRNQVIRYANGTKTHISIITFTAWKEQNNFSLSCIVQLKEGLITAQEITLKVEHPPRALKIKCLIYNKEPNILSSSNCTMDINNTIYALEGSQLSLTCSADSIPKSSLVWKYANESQIPSSMGNLIFTNVSLSHEGFYTCQATNPRGTQETSVTIKIISQSIPNAFPVAVISGGCFAAVLIVIAVLFMIFYRRRKIAQIKENSKQTNVNIIDPIYGNSEIFSTGLHGIRQTPKRDHQPNAGAESENQNSQGLQYMSVNFSNLKANIPTDAEEVEVEYSVIKCRN